MLVPLYILWFKESFGLALVALVVIGATDSGATIGWIREDCLPRFTGGQVTTKYQWNGLQFDNNIGGSWQTFLRGKQGLILLSGSVVNPQAYRTL